MPDPFDFWVVLFMVAIVGYYLSTKYKYSGVPYPPGPEPLPIIGNALQIPKVRSWITYASWKKEYGDLIHLSALGYHIIVIHSMDIATDLLEKRSRNYSDRPEMPMVTLSGWTEINGGTLPYGNLWRKHRRLFHQQFRSEAVSDLQPLQLRKAQKFLHNLLGSPEEFAIHSRYFPASVVMYITYGQEIAPRRDPIISLVDEATTMITETALPGSHLVNVFPLLRHVPGWMPGTGFKRKAQQCKEVIDEMQNVPFNAVRQRMAAGTAIPCWTSDMLEKIHAEGGGREEEDILKGAASTSIAAAVDTTSSTLQSFFLAMTLYPNVQAKAQAEIDRVVGNKRLPDFDDRESLPFVEALCRELLRWQPPLPLGVPHSVIDSDIYNGYLIPRGAIILPNIWAMCRDERVYSRPNEFIPERFLTPDAALANTATPLAFGFGRRICVGRALADTMLWIAVVSVLSVFDIKKAKDGSGKEIEVREEYSDAAISDPLPFQCSITPRSPDTKQLIITPIQ